MTAHFEAMSYALVGVACATAAAVFDFRTRCIPNYLTLPAIVFGIVLHLVFGGWGQMLSSLAAGGLCLVLFFIFYAAGGMGAGDVKLMTALGCIFGLSMVGWLLIMTSLAGGVMALAIALYRGRLSNTLRNVLSIVAHHGSQGLVPHPELNLDNEQSLRLPYGIAILAGSVSSLCLLIAQEVRP